MSGAQFQALLASGGKVSAAFLGGAVVGAATSHSMSTSFGTQAADFYVIAVIAIGSNSNVGTVTIAGVAATIIAQPFSGSCGATMAIAKVPAGTATGNVVFTTATNSEGIMAAYRMDGLGHSAPTSFNTTASHTYNAPVNSTIIGIAAGFAHTGAPSFSWSGITADYTNSTTGAGGSSAHNNLTSPNSSLTAAATITNAGDGSAVVSALFSP